jgi:capsule polysaccharide export protein KpsE/RkpR
MNALNGSTDDRLSSKVFLLQRDVDEQIKNVSELKTQLSTIHSQLNILQTSISVMMSTVSRTDAQVIALEKEFNEAQRWRYKMIGANGVLVFFASILATFLIGFFR